MQDGLIYLLICTPSLQPPDLVHQVQPPQPNDYRRDDLDKWLVRRLTGRERDAQWLVRMRFQYWIICNQL